MATESNNTKLKVGLGILAALLIAASALFVLKNNELKETKITLNSEKEVLEADLESVRNDLSLQINDNEVLNEELIAKRDSLDIVIENLKQSELDVKDLMKYKYSFFKLKKEVKKLTADNVALQQMNTQLSKEKDSIFDELGAQRVLADSLNTQISDKNMLIQSASELTVAGLKGIAIIEKSSGKQAPTDKARRADKVKVCFTVAENKITDAGDKEMYVQVLDAKNNVLGANAMKAFEEKTLNYSFKSDFNYNNKALDICEYLAAPEDGFEAGNYFVNVFVGAKLVSNTSFVLK